MERLSSFWRLKCTSTKDKREGTSKCVLYREVFSIVSFIQSPLSEILLYNLSQV